MTRAADGARRTRRTTARSEKKWWLAREKVSADEGRETSCSTNAPDADPVDVVVHRSCRVGGWRRGSRRRGVARGEEAGAADEPALIHSSSANGPPERQMKAREACGHADADADADARASLSLLSTAAKARSPLKFNDRATDGPRADDRVRDSAARMIQRPLSWSRRKVAGAVAVMSMAGAGAGDGSGVGVCTAVPVVVVVGS
jgi:hypothetical protein